MNRIHASLGAAFVAASLVSFGALAADNATQGKSATGNADRTQVVPSRDDLKPGAAPTSDSMDANAQRQHDRDRDAGATAQGGAATGVNARTTGAEADARTGTAAKGVRDWDAIDTNNDNLIEPAEMEKALKAVGPQAKPQQPKS